MLFDGFSPDWVVLTAAFVSGLLGGVHCAAMCGGIAVGLSVGSPATTSMQGLWRALQPNAGRIIGYAIAGALAGGVGHGLVALVRQPQFTLALRASVGVVMLALAWRLLFPGRGNGLLARPAQALWQTLRPLQRHLLPADTAPKRLAVGMLWGWLPCGLSATLLVAAWLQGNAVHGALTMIAFGLGTLPLMWPLTWSGARIAAGLQRRGARIAAGWLLLAAGTATLAAPWLTHLPAVHSTLSALGCRTLGA